MCMCALVRVLLNVSVRYIRISAHILILHFIYTHFLLSVVRKACGKGRECEKGRVSEEGEGKELFKTAYIIQNI